MERFPFRPRGIADRFLRALHSQTRPIRPQASPRFGAVPLVRPPLNSEQARRGRGCDAQQQNSPVVQQPRSSSGRINSAGNIQQKQDETSPRREMDNEKLKQTSANETLNTSKTQDLTLLNDQCGVGAEKEHQAVPSSKENDHKESAMVADLSREDKDNEGGQKDSCRAAPNTNKPVISPATLDVQVPAMSQNKLDPKTNKSVSKTEYNKKSPKPETKKCSPKPDKTLKSERNKSDSQTEKNKPSPNSVKSRPSPKSEKTKPSPKSEKTKPSPKSEKTKPSPKKEQNRPSPKSEKIKPVSKTDKNKHDVKRKEEGEHDSTLGSPELPKDSVVSEQSSPVKRQNDTSNSQQKPSPAIKAKTPNKDSKDKPASIPTRFNFDPDHINNIYSSSSKEKNSPSSNNGVGYVNAAPVPEVDLIQIGNSIQYLDHHLFDTYLPLLEIQEPSDATPDQDPSSHQKGFEPLAPKCKVPLIPVDEVSQNDLDVQGPSVLNANGEIRWPFNRNEVPTQAKPQPHPYSSMSHNVRQMFLLCSDKADGDKATQSSYLPSQTHDGHASSHPSPNPYNGVRPSTQHEHSPNPYNGVRPPTSQNPYNGVRPPTSPNPYNGVRPPTQHEHSPNPYNGPRLPYHRAHSQAPVDNSSQVVKTQPYPRADRDCNRHARRPYNNNIAFGTTLAPLVGQLIEEASYGMTSQNYGEDYTDANYPPIPPIPKPIHDYFPYEPPVYDERGNIDLEMKSKKQHWFDNPLADNLQGLALRAKRYLGGTLNAANCDDTYDTPNPQRDPTPYNYTSSNRAQYFLQHVKRMLAGFNADMQAYGQNQQTQQNVERRMSPSEIQSLEHHMQNSLPSYLVDMLGVPEHARNDVQNARNPMQNIQNRTQMRNDRPSFAPGQSFPQHQKTTKKRPQPTQKPAATLLDLGSWGPFFRGLTVFNCDTSTKEIPESIPPLDAQCQHIKKVIASVLQDKTFEPLNRKKLTDDFDIWIPPTASFDDHLDTPLQELKSSNTVNGSSYYCFEEKKGPKTGMKTPKYLQDAWDSTKDRWNLSSYVDQSTSPSKAFMPLSHARQQSHRDAVVPILGGKDFVGKPLEVYSRLCDGDNCDKHGLPRLNDHSKEKGTVESDGGAEGKGSVGGTDEVKDSGVKASRLEVRVIPDWYFDRTTINKEPCEDDGVELEDKKGVGECVVMNGCGHGVGGEVKMGKTEGLRRRQLDIMRCSYIEKDGRIVEVGR